MKKLFCILAVGIFAGNLLAQSEGGILNKSLTGTTTLSAWNAEQALNALTQPYTMKMADSTAVGSVATKYGTHHRLCRIANISRTAQYVKVIIYTSGDTATVCIPSQSVSERIPFVSKIISGAVADSTRYDFLYK